VKTYLGDAVYAEIDRAGDLILTTEDGIQDTNRIVLEPEVLHNLETWLEAAREAAARGPCPTHGIACPEGPVLKKPSDP
jgi:hypothetical protein